MLSLAIWVLSLVPSAGFAQYSMLEDMSPRLEWQGRLQADYQGEFETKTDGGDKFESWRLGVSGDFGLPVRDFILVGFHARYQHADYDFDLQHGAFPSAAYDTNELPKEPWGGIDTIDLMPTTTLLLGDRFSIVAAVPIRWSGEVGTDRNGFAAGISAIAGWQVLDSLRVGLGIGITSRIEGNSETFPIIALDWQINESLRLATEGGWIQGGAAGLYWGPNEVLTLSFTVGYERNRFRLDDNGTTRDTNGVGEITAVPIELGLRLQIAPGAYLDVRGGLGVAGRFRVEDDGGKKLYDQNYDPAPRFRVGLTIPFGAAASSSNMDSSNAREWDDYSEPDSSSW